MLRLYMRVIKASRIQFGTVEAWVGGAPPATGCAAMVVLHGHDQAASMLLPLCDEVDPDASAAAVLPEAPPRGWCPPSPEWPVRPEALAIVDAVTDELLKHRDPDRLLLIGIAEGACLAAEWLVRRPGRYGGVGCLAGGLLLGAEDAAKGVDLQETPVLLSSSRSPYETPLTRMERTADLLTEANADVVTLREPMPSWPVQPRVVGLLRQMLKDLER